MLFMYLSSHSECSLLNKAPPTPTMYKYRPTYSPGKNHTALTHAYANQVMHTEPDSGAQPGETATHNVSCSVCLFRLLIGIFLPFSLLQSNASSFLLCLSFWFAVGHLGLVSQWLSVDQYP